MLAETIQPTKITITSHIETKKPLSYLRGFFLRCLAVLKWSILIGIITLKHALQCAIRHIAQLLIRVIPKKCCQMLSRGFLPHFRQHNRLILWRLTKNNNYFFVRPKDFFQLFRQHQNTSQRTPSTSLSQSSFSPVCCHHRNGTLQGVSCQYLFP